MMTTALFENLAAKGKEEWSEIQIKSASSESNSSGAKFRTFRLSHGARAAFRPAFSAHLESTSRHECCW
jgi:hypothetical protein